MHLDRQYLSSSFVFFTAMRGRNRECCFRPSHRIPFHFILHLSFPFRPVIFHPISTFLLPYFPSPVFTIPYYPDDSIISLFVPSHPGADVPTTVYLAMGDALSHGTNNNSNSPRVTSPNRTERTLPYVFERLPSLETSDLSQRECSRERSVGACVTRAVESASRRLVSLGALLKQGDCTTDGAEAASLADDSDDIARRFWSTEAEAFLDGVANLVAKILETLDHEVSRDREAVSEEEIRGEGAKNDREDTIAERKASSRRVPGASPADSLLVRVLSFGLVKQDLEGVRGGAHGKGGAGEAEAAAGLVRELSEKLGGFSSVLERLDATNTLLLAGCYFKGVRDSSKLSRE